MDSLPPEIIFDILTRLPIKSLMLCRCVSKPWRTLATDPHFIHSHLTRSSSENPSLILNSTISFNTISFHTQLHFIEQHHYHKILRYFSCTDLNFTLPNFQEFQVIGSCNGMLWLVHRWNRSSSYICNPFVSDCIECPVRVSYGTLDLVRGFGFSPITNEYKLVEIVNMNKVCAIDPKSKVYVYTLGDRLWRFLGVVPYVISGQYASNVLVNGALHWVSSLPNNLIVSFDFANEMFGLTPRPQINIRQGVYSLGVLSGCLSITDSSFDDRVDIWVMKDYGVKESWAKFLSINFDQIGRNIRFIRTLCLSKNGELLMVYNNQALLSYNNRTMSLRKLSISGLPSWFEAVNHVGSLVSPSGCLRNNR